MNTKTENYNKAIREVRKEASKGYKHELKNIPYEYNTLFALIMTTPKNQRDINIIAPFI